MTSKNHSRLLKILLVVLCILFAGSMLPPITARADMSGGLKKLRQVKNHPCISYTYHPGNPYTLPYVSCLGRKSTTAFIHIPIRKMEIFPSYPLVHEIFHVAIGLDPDSAGGTFTSKKVTLQFKEKIKINGYHVEVRLVPLPISNNFNGKIYGDGSMAFHSPPVDDQGDFPDFSASGVDQLSYGNNYVDSTNVNTTSLLGMSASMSSYHAADPVYFQGEPAYPLTATSAWRMEARAHWDSYQLWVYQGTYEVCAWGRNEYGWFECDVGDGDPWWEGRYVEVERYGWGAKITNGMKTDWIPIVNVSTNLVRWPDGTVHDSYPLHVYQSQPLLQKP